MQYRDDKKPYSCLWGKIYYLLALVYAALIVYTQQNTHTLPTWMPVCVPLSMCVLVCVLERNGKFLGRVGVFVIGVSLAAAIYEYESYFMSKHGTEITTNLFVLLMRGAIQLNVLIVFALFGVCLAYPASSIADLFAYGTVLGCAMLHTYPAAYRSTSFSPYFESYMATYIRTHLPPTPTSLLPNPLYAEPVRALFLVPYTCAVGGCVGMACGAARFLERGENLNNLLAFFNIALPLMPHHLIFGMCVALTGEAYTYQAIMIGKMIHALAPVGCVYGMGYALTKMQSWYKLLCASNTLTHTHTHTAPRLAHTDGHYVAMA